MTQSDRDILTRAMKILFAHEAGTWSASEEILESEMGKSDVESLMKLSLLDLLSGITLADVRAAGKLTQP